MSRLTRPFVMATVALALAMMSSIAPAGELTLPGGARGGPLVEPGPMDEMSAARRAEVQSDLDRSVADLLARGAIRAAGKAAGVLFGWPAQLVPGASDAVPNVIANYVDQDPSFPNHVRDWNCGVRSYDLASGYNHGGIDISAFPFSWIKLDHDEMIVVAAAAGTIVKKDDGAYDRNCGPLGTLPVTTPVNAIYVRHADGSIAWYLHMKSGSLTPKHVGETVEAGERLGSVGSSGFSSGPHVHFEVHDLMGGLIDPYAGACNTRNADSWWAQQPAYWQPAIVRASIHSAVPQFSNCTAPDAPRQTSYATAGETIYATVYLRDFLAGASIPVRVLAPDGSTFFAGTIGGPPQNYVASYWYYALALPPFAPAGAWRFEADLDGATTRTTFYVTTSLPSIATAVEYYHAGIDHYFVTADADEIAGLDAGAFGGVWHRTGQAFGVYTAPAAGLAPVCRFYSTSFAPQNSHFYTADPVECEGLKHNPDWQYERIAFHVPLPDASGACPTGTSPVYRMFNGGQGGAPNHRFTTSYATRLAFAPGKGWIQEGVPPTGAGMCAPLGA
jgi:hypothetical protein